MTRLNAHFSVEGISIIEFSDGIVQLSSVQFKQYLCNQVGDIAGNEVSPTKHARGDRQRTKTPSVTEQRKKTLGETRLIRGASSPLARRTSSLYQVQQSQIVRAPLIPVVFSRWLSR